MTVRSLNVMFVGVLAMWSAKTVAHHSIAGEFDGSNIVDVTGTVVELKLINPHTYILLDVENEAGEVERWTLNFGPASKLIRGMGWHAEILQPGDVVTAQGRRAREYPGMYLSHLVTDDGEVLLDALVE